MFHQRRISLQNMNPTVRGIRASPQMEIQSQAALITQQISKGATKTYKEVIDVSSGDPYRAGMKPFSFVRQVLAVCLYPPLLEDENLPEDVRLRAARLLQACDGGSVGSYTASSGMLYCRQRIAEFITRRDGVPSSANDVFITSGSQRALMVVVKLLASEDAQNPVGILIPVPGPHTLPSVLDQAGLDLVPYRLQEGPGWTVDLDELHRAVKTTRGRCEPRAIYISNPGNPTGHVQDRRSMQDVIQFAAAQRLLLLVDEVHQDFVYDLHTEFLSYKKVLFEMSKELSETVEMVSFHSISSMGECGLRGGYIEVVNMDPEVKFYVDTVLCGDISTPLPGQLALELMTNPPKPGDPSYDTHTQETLILQKCLSNNARRAHEFLNNLPGMSCQPAMGGIYLYPRLDLPSHIKAEAEALGIGADVLYCQKLLEEQGLVVGAGKDNETTGSCHLRFCFHVPPDILEEALARLRSFHLLLMDGHLEMGLKGKTKAAKGQLHVESP